MQISVQDTTEFIARTKHTSPAIKMSAATFSITTLSIVSLSIITLSIVTLSLRAYL